MNSIEEKSNATKHCLKCHEYRNEKPLHTENDRCLIGTWPITEIKKAFEKG